MRKRRIILAVIMLLAGGTFAGCARTPEDSVVKLKGKDNEKIYEEVSGDTAFEGEEKEGQTLREILKAPKNYKSEEKDETGFLTISTDAVVEIPEAEKASVIKVSRHNFNQEIIDRVTEVFFPNAKIYSGNSYFRRTKQTVLKELNKWKSYLAAGELDPNGLGKDEKGNYYFDINQVIERLEEEYETAPESSELVEVKPQFGLENIDYEGNGDVWVDKDGFSGVAETPEGKHYHYWFARNRFMPFELGIRDMTAEEALDTMESISWSEYGNYSPKNNNFKEFPDEEKLKEQEEMTFEEAKVLQMKRWKS